MTTPAGNRLYNLHLFAGLVLDEVPDKYIAVYACVRRLFSGWVRTKALKAGVVGLYGVVVIVGVYAGGVH